MIGKCLQWEREPANSSTESKLCGELQMTASTTPAVFLLDASGFCGMLLAPPLKDFLSLSVAIRFSLLESLTRGDAALPRALTKELQLVKTPSPCVLLHGACVLSHAPLSFCCLLLYSLVLSHCTLNKHVAVRAKAWLLWIILWPTVWPLPDSAISSVKQTEQNLP